MVVLLIACCWIWPPADAPASSPGDHEFMVGNYTAAVAAYDSLLLTSQDPARILWRLARVYVCIGDIAEDSLKENAYLKAERYARTCLNNDSTVSEAHAWLAAALGNIAMNAGGKKKVLLCNEIKEHLERAIVLDPGNDIAYSILGSLYMALGNVSWIERQLAYLFLGDLPEGGYEDAEQALLNAVGIAPRVIRHHYELATLYRATGNTPKALQEYSHALALPSVLASDPRTKESARRWLGELRDEE